MTCSQCWSSIPARSEKCPRCGAKATGAPPSFAGLLKSYPWLGALLALSIVVTLWAVTRRPAPPPEPIAPAVEPVTVAPAPAPEAEPEAVDWPTPPPAPEAVAEQAPPPAPASSAVRPPMPVDPSAPLAGAQRPDGTWEPGPGAPKLAP